jgi:hypothetical protein
MRSNKLTENYIVEFHDLENTYHSDIHSRIYPKRAEATTQDESSSA